MKDIFQKDLHIGDAVLFCRYGNSPIRMGIVTSVGGTGCQISYMDNSSKISHFKATQSDRGLIQYNYSDECNTLNNNQNTKELYNKLKAFMEIEK